MMTDKEKCVEKAHALADELYARYGVKFSCICGAGAEVYFELTKYGAPCIHINGNIINDNYCVHAWANERAREYLYSSGYNDIPKPVMILVLDKLLNRKAHPTKQMELF